MTAKRKSKGAPSPNPIKDFVDKAYKHRVAINALLKAQNIPAALAYEAALDQQRHHKYDRAYAEAFNKAFSKAQTDAQASPSRAKSNDLFHFTRENRCSLISPAFHGSWADGF